MAILAVNEIGEKNIGFFYPIRGLAELNQAGRLHRQAKGVHSSRDIADPGHQFIMGVAYELLILE